MNSWWFKSLKGWLFLYLSFSVQRAAKGFCLLFLGVTTGICFALHLVSTLPVHTRRLCLDDPSFKGPWLDAFNLPKAQSKVGSFTQRWAFVKICVKLIVIMLKEKHLQVGPSPTKDLVGHKWPLML